MVQFLTTKRTLMGGLLNPTHPLWCSKGGEAVVVAVVRDMMGVVTGGDGVAWMVMSCCDDGAAKVVVRDDGSGGCYDDGLGGVGGVGGEEGVDRWVRVACNVGDGGMVMAADGYSWPELLRRRRQKNYWRLCVCGG
ncbi:hypothetical protein Tco_0766195 [Tanacetum coccineum]